MPTSFGTAWGVLKSFEFAFSTYVRISRSRPVLLKVGRIGTGTEKQTVLRDSLCANPVSQGKEGTVNSGKKVDDGISRWQGLVLRFLCLFLFSSGLVRHHLLQTLLVQAGVICRNFDVSLFGQRRPNPF